MDKELQNLYVVARRAREDFNSRLAAQYYDRILQKQPMSWEAYFYATYFSLCSFTILEIPRTAQTMRKCLGNTFALIRDHVEDEAEQNAAVCEAASSCQALASMLDGGAVLYYQHLDPGKQQRFQDVFQMSRIEVAYFLRDLGDLANRVFEDAEHKSSHARLPLSSRNAVRRVPASFFPACRRPGALYRLEKQIPYYPKGLRFLVWISRSFKGACPLFGPGKRLAIVPHFCYTRHEKQKCGSLRVRQHPQACTGANPPTQRF